MINDGTKGLLMTLGGIAAAVGLGKLGQPGLGSQATRDDQVDVILLAKLYPSETEGGTVRFNQGRRNPPNRLAPLASDLVALTYPSAVTLDLFGENSARFLSSQHFHQIGSTAVLFLRLLGHSVIPESHRLIVDDPSVIYGFSRAPNGGRISDEEIARSVQRAGLSTHREDAEPLDYGSTDSVIAAFLHLVDWAVLPGLTQDQWRLVVQKAPGLLNKRMILGGRKAPYLCDTMVPLSTHSPGDLK
jgi:hypothetical protein